LGGVSEAYAEVAQRLGIFKDPRSAFVEG
jgi:hypothetical protein